MAKTPVTVVARKLTAGHRYIGVFTALRFQTWSLMITAFYNLLTFVLLAFVCY